MRPALFIFILFWGLSLFLSGCKKQQQYNFTVDFEPLGIRIKGLNEPCPVNIYDQEGRLLLAYPPMGNEVFLFLNWRPGLCYRLGVGNISKIIKAPGNKPWIEIKVQAPLGQQPKTFFFPENKKRQICSKGTVVTLPFEIIGKARNNKIGIQLRSHSEKDIKFNLNGRTGHLRQPFETVFEIIGLSFDDEKGPVKVPLEIMSPGHKRIILLFKKAQTDLKHAISLLSWKVPTNAFGFIEQYRLQGTLILPSTLWDQIGYVLGLKVSARSRFDPVSYQCLELKNHLGIPVTLLLTADFLDSSGNQVNGFYPRRFGPTGGTKKILAFVDIAPKEKAKAVLPIFIDDTVKPGTYIQRVTVSLLGQKEPLMSLTRKLGLVRGSSFFTGGLLIIMLISLVYAFLVTIRFKKMISQFNLSSLVLIALMGAVGFGLDFVGGIASNFLNALLGPFNILVGGLITEVSHYLVLTAVLYLIPYWGTVTLSGLVSYLMGTMLTGGFGILDVFFVASSLAYAEAMLYLSGITRTRTVEGKIVALALALAVADALMTGTSLILHSMFYRLFYPLWYVGLAVTVKGFLYTFIGVMIGAPFGRNLRKMQS